MMKYITITYRGVKLIIPEWLEPLWPYDLPLYRWPTFCGAGSGLGDKIVPEYCSGVFLSPQCFIHDIDWASSPDTIREFFAANLRLLKNIISGITSSELPWWRKAWAITKACGIWFMAVSTIGAMCFGPLGSPTGNPLDNPEVKEKLNRLVMARIQWQKDMRI